MTLIAEKLGRITAAVFVEAYTVLLAHHCAQCHMHRLVSSYPDQSLGSAADATAWSAPGQDNGAVTTASETASLESPARLELCELTASLLAATEGAQDGSVRYNQNIMAA